MPRLIRNNSLSLALLALFVATLLAQCVTGWISNNDDLDEHHQPEIGLAEYLTDGHFVEAVFENWESEFLQDAAYVLLTAWLIQRGSAESKDPEKDEAVDEDPAAKRGDPSAPWPVRRGGIWLALYKRSLLIVFLALFGIAFMLHAAGGAAEYTSEQLQHGGQPVSLARYLLTARFWFESFQNWQSEFLALFAMVTLSIFLRQQGSPESKPVASPHSQTGSA